MSKKLIKFICVEGNLLVKKIDVSTNLKEVRNLFADKFEMEYSFLMDGSIIDKDDEKDITIEDICTSDNNILIKKSEKLIIVNKPIPNSKKIGKVDLDIYLYPSEKFSLEEETKSITLMVFGEIGSGKTTLLNSLINFVMGIQLNDTFRYYLINEETGRIILNSQTSEVAIYYIKAYNGFPPLKIIDIPGFGDTRGFEEEQKITEKIKKKIKEELDYINGICIVTRSSNIRLTATQRYVFSKIMELFGNDVAENLIAMITFCDGNTPPVVEYALPELFDKLIHSIGNPWYFKFNNSAIFSGNKDEFTQMFWKIGMESFSTFFKKLVTIPRKSLVKSKEVLKERQAIETTIQNLIPKLDQGLEIIEKIKKQVHNIAKNDKNEAEKIIEGLIKDLEKLQLELLETQDKIRISIDRLKEIALINNTFESSEEYINIMILSEKESKKAGYLDRIKALENLKSVHKLIRDLYKGNIEEFKKYFFEKKKNELDKCNIF